MKKLTAGIFTVLMGLVSVNAANAAVASKAYVDAKAATEASAAQSAAETAAANALSTAKSELEGKIDAKVAQTAYDTKVAELAQADTTNLQAAKDYADGLDAAQKTAFETADSAINDKIGEVAEGKTVVQMIADAQSSATYDDAELRGLIGDNADAISAMDAAYKTADTQVLTDAKDYTDALANGAVKSNTDAIAAINDVNNGILKQAQTYADQAEADAITAAEAKVTELANGAVKTNTDAIAALNDTYVSESEMTSFKATNSEAIADAKKAGTDAATALETYKTSNNAAVADAQSAAEAAQAAADAAQSAADAAQADATQALADAAAAQSAAEAAQTQADKGVADAAVAQATANAAIPKPQGQCSNPTNKCVLTFNNSAYTWEVIERATDETGF